MMSTKAQAILEANSSVAADRTARDFPFYFGTSCHPSAASRHRTISDIAGKYRANPDPEAKDHDRGFAAAAAD